MPLIAITFYSYKFDGNDAPWASFVASLKSGLSVHDLDNSHINELIDAVAIRTGFHSEGRNSTEQVAHTHWRIVTVQHGDYQLGQFLLWSRANRLEVSPLWTMANERLETRALTGEASYIQGRIVHVGDVCYGGSAEWPGIRIYQRRNSVWQTIWTYESKEESGWVEATPKDPSEIHFRRYHGQIDESHIHFVIRKEPRPFSQSHMGEWLQYDVYGIAKGPGYRIESVRRENALAFATDLVRWAQKGSAGLFDAKVPKKYRAALRKRLRSIEKSGEPTISTKGGTVIIENPHVVIHLERGSGGWRVRDFD